MLLISLAEVLTIMDSTAEPFTIGYATADRQRRTGGEVILLEGCVQTGAPEKLKRPQSAPAPATAALPAKAHKPAHRANQTRNVTILSSGKTRKLHIRLIMEFNGQKVRW